MFFPKTASLIGIGRDESKILNYARIYGAGVTFAERLLLQFNRQLSSAEAKSKARTMYKMTKVNNQLFIALYYFDTKRGWSLMYYDL